jgi:hypothetical protein
MAEYCPNCFEKLDALHMCGGSEKLNVAPPSGSEVWGINKSLTNFVVFAPLMGVVLDFILPLPSSLIHSVIVSLVGSALASIIWVVLKYQGEKSIKFFFLNLKNFLYTPNLLKVFGSDGSRKSTTYWLGVIALSTVLQVIIFTPGNGTYLAHQVTKKIDDASGANLKVECPKTKIYFYNETLECRVKTGILGISVPARISMSPLLGTSDIKVSLF